MKSLAIIYGVALLVIGGSIVYMNAQVNELVAANRAVIVPVSAPHRVAATLPSFTIPASGLQGSTPLVQMPDMAVPPVH